MNGTWKLRVTDTDAGDAGVIGCVKLDLTRQLAFCCGIQTDLTATLLDGGSVISAGGPQSYGALSPIGPAVTRPFALFISSAAVCGSDVVATFALSDNGLDHTAVDADVRHIPPHQQRSARFVPRAGLRSRRRTSRAPPRRALRHGRRAGLQHRDHLPERRGDVGADGAGDCSVRTIVPMDSVISAGSPLSSASPRGCGCGRWGDRRRPTPRPGRDSSSGTRRGGWRPARIRPARARR